MNETQGRTKERLLSLDFYKGLTMFYSLLSFDIYFLILFHPSLRVR